MTYIPKREWYIAAEYFTPLVWVKSGGSLCLILLLAGCVGTMQRRPAPVTESGVTTVTAPSEVVTPAEVRESSGVVLRAYESPAPISARPVHSSAVASLIATARQQEAAGNLQGAVATMERALGIEPRNAHLWYRLAQLRLAQNRITLANDLAMKSKALAGADRELKRDNWQLIAKARRAKGDEAGARVAERKARMLFY
ncbi:MAG: tetratricopeptide repeat protein [Sedimenticola sp.]